MALYVFGIGGTGARVIKALTMLMASGVQLANTNSVVPVLIDPDNANGDLTRTLELLRLYRSLRASTDPNKRDFFHNEIRSLADAEGGNTTNEYHFSIAGIGNNRFKDFIELGSMSRSSQAMMRMLFSGHNLDADMQVGFKGNPNIGSVVLNHFKDSDTFKAFANAFNPGDRIVIIGSIFGGTGAAGLPLLIKNLRDANEQLPKHELLRNAPIAAISVLPYFDVQEQEHVTIDSSTFFSKTKAALSYYAANLCKNQSVNALYYLGDTVANTHKGADGAEEQKNKAHFVELAAALAIVDFMKYSSQELLVERGKAVRPLYFEYGLQQDVKDNIALKHLGPRSYEAGKHLTRYFLFQKFLRDCYAQVPPNTAWLRNGNNKLTPESFRQNFWTDLTRFNAAFDEWLAEMEQSQTAFRPFHRSAGEKDILNTVVGTSEKQSWNVLESKGAERYSKILSKHEEKLKPAPGSEAKLFNLFSAATSEIIRERINL